jgi:hypothetical protein
MKALIDKRSRLEAQPAEEARWEHSPTGTTYAQAWEAADIAERRDLLASADLKAVACRPAIDAPAWFDPDKDAMVPTRACRVYAAWSPRRL